MKRPSHRTVVTGGVVLCCTTVALFVEWATTPPPRERQIHLTAFRYGIEPSIIRAARGDTLVLTFSSRDTGHSFFLQDYRIDAKITPENEQVEVYDPLLVHVPPKRTREVRLTAGLSGWLGALVSVSRHRCHVYCGPMHAFEQGDLIVRPNWLFAVCLGLLVAIPIAGYYRVRAAPNVLRPVAADFDLLRLFPLLGRMMRWRPLQFTLTLPVLALFLLSVLAGLFGTKVGGRNLAVMSTWVVWMFIMAVVLAPLNSRIWCTVCPLPVIGEYVQRGSLTAVHALAGQSWGNRFIGLGWRWPRWLRGEWLRQVSFLCIGTLAASFAGMPRWTALLLLVLAGLATVMALVWERRAFCQYLCPVTSFLNVYSGAGRVMVRARDRETCRRCPDKPCYRGNAEGWACPFGVYAASLDSNAECGVCTECFKSCTYDNITLAWRRGPMRERFRTVGQAWQALAMLALAMAYCLLILSPWPALRDVINIVDRAHGPHFLLYAGVLWTTALVLVPGLYVLLVRWGVQRAGLALPLRVAFRRVAPAAVPLGLGLWIAFFSTMMMVHFTFVLMALSDPFGWNWDLLGMAGAPWVQVLPGLIPWLQAGLTIGGLVLSLRLGFCCWLGETGDARRAWRGFAPSAAMLLAVAALMTVYFTQF